jgi:hypothetical protein
MFAGPQAERDAVIWVTSYRRPLNLTYMIERCLGAYIYVVVLWDN